MEEQQQHHECKKNRTISKLIWEINNMKKDLITYKKEFREEVVKMNEEMKQGFSNIQRLIMRFLIFVITVSFGIISFLVINYVLNN